VKILYIHQYFRTPEEGGCTRSFHFAKGLVKAGHEVVMITAHNDRKMLMDIDGITVHYLHVAYANHFGFFKRIYSYLKFSLLATLAARKIKDIDLSYVMTTPLTTGLVALHLKKRLKIPFIFEVGDLWPEAPVQMEVIQNAWLKSILYRFEKRCYDEAQAVVALSPAIQDYIQSVSPSTNVHVITNLAHCSFFQPYTPPKFFTQEHPLRIGYIGTFGKANHLEALIAVASKCHFEKLPIQFHLKGEGAEFDKIQRLSAHLPNVHFQPFGPATEVKLLLEKIDAVYISFKNIPVLNTGSPNKFFDGLAAGKLIITNFGGWIEKVLLENQCGFSHNPEMPERFIEKIMPFLNEPNLLTQAQKQSRNLAEQFYDKELMIKKLVRILEDQGRKSSF
jgi:glycosyltransferase involved in cell wall biosynthesis